MVPPSRRRALGTALLVLLGVAWVVAPVWLLLLAVGEMLTFFGEVPTDAERARSDRLLVAAVLTAVGVALAGVLVAVWQRRRVAGSVFGVALTIALLVAVLVLGSVPPDTRSARPVRDPGGACQEHSGGDNRCPGG